MKLNHLLPVIACNSKRIVIVSLNSYTRSEERTKQRIWFTGNVFKIQVAKSSGDDLGVEIWSWIGISWIINDICKNVIIMEIFEKPNLCGAVELANFRCVSEQYKQHTFLSEPFFLMGSPAYQYSTTLLIRNFTYFHWFLSCMLYMAKLAMYKVYMAKFLK